MLLFLFAYPTFGQNVGIGTANPDSSALLDLSSTNSGLLIPRMTSTQRDLIPNPANGLQIYNTTTDCLEIYFPKSGWKSIVCDCISSPPATFTYSPGQPDTTSNVTFSPTFIGAGASYSWTFSGGNPGTSTQQNPVVNWLSTGTYPVSLTVTDSSGCSGSYTDNITIGQFVPVTADTFYYTGSMQTFTVPAGKTTVHIKVWGAQGGQSTYQGNTIDGGLGGYAEGDLAVTPGQTLYVAVGRKGCVNTNPTAGWNGGGCAGNGSIQGYGGGGGDGSDVRVGGQTFNDRVIVAGGGGGAWTNPTWPVGTGGAGGGIAGDSVAASYASGGTQSAGGVPTNGSWSNFAGGFGYGGDYGNGSWPNSCGNGGGGGGGWYGGSAASGCCAGPGAGGSGYIGGVTNGSMQSGLKTGDGLIIISY